MDSGPKLTTCHYSLSTGEEDRLSTFMLRESTISNSPDDTFALGERIGRALRAGDVVLLYGGLGAGKTLLTKGIVSSLGFDVDEVSSPSFTLVNLYRTEAFDTYHIDLWRLDGGEDAAEAVGLDEILDKENAVVIVEWADRLRDSNFPNNTLRVRIEGDGDDPRRIEITSLTTQIGDLTV